MQNLIVQQNGIFKSSRASGGMKKSIKVKGEFQKNIHFHHIFVSVTYYTLVRNSRNDNYFRGKMFLDQNVSIKLVDDDPLKV